MTEKEKLILDLLGDPTPVEELKQRQLDTLEDFNQNGYGDIHPSNIESIKDGLHYTHGYCVGHIELLKKITELISMGVTELADLKSENDRVVEDNRKMFDNLLKEIKDGLHSD